MTDKPSVPFSAYKRPPYKTRQPTSADANPASRPKLAREDTDNLLSYYQSPIADEGRNYSRPLSPEKPHAARTPQNNPRKASTASTSSSDYSDESEVTDAHNIASVAASAKKRPSTLSKGGADKRRIAIVEMDRVGEQALKSNLDISSSTTSTSVRSRRAHGNNTLTGLALVAPPDASFKSYTQFTPPSTAPVSSDYMNHTHSAMPQDKGHHRAASENPADLDKAVSRDTGSVGVAQGHKSKPPFLSAANNNGPTKNTKTEDKNTDTASPANVFQRSTLSRSPSPTKPSDLGNRNHLNLSPLDRTPMSTRTVTSQILTPAIGEGKEIHVPVAGPVVVKLDNLPPRTTHSTASWRSESPTPSYGSGSNHGSSYSATSSYLRYEPGVHATAGPLPPPPRAIFNIDTTSPPPPRPPRLHSPTPLSTPSRMRGDFEAVKQALQLPPSVSAVLSSKLSNNSLAESLSIQDKKPMKEGNEKIKEKNEVQEKTEVQEQEEDVSSEEQDEAMNPTKSIHRREGATLSASTDSTSEPTSSRVAASSSENSSVHSPEEKLSPGGTPADDPDDAPAVTIVAPPRSTTLPPEAIDHSKFDKWLEENPQMLTQPLEGRRSTSLDERRESLEHPLSPSPDYSMGEAPSPPPKSFRNSLTTNLKRFSALPRTPSLSSKSARRSSGSTRHSSRTPSPSIHMFARPTFKKIKSTNPAALFCHEVHSQTTTLQRCAIYVAKINELYIHDSGLSEWVDDTKIRGQSNHTQRRPSTKPFTPQPRQTSRSSMISDATFPIRPDASVATDLSQGAYRDITPPGVPSLPYPSLAINPPPHARPPTRSNSSAGSGTPTSSIRSLAPTPSLSLKGGFFASLGRKTSISGARKDKYLPTISAPIPISTGLAGRAGSKHSHTSVNFSRAINGTNLPSVPGGPRAPPNRAQRSQTFMTSPIATSPLDRSANQDLTRRPSLFNITSDTVIDIHPEPEFAQQVDKLHALIPHADRDVLAGYLRRAGQDMLAIGQYLEDERMGTIQRF